MGSDIQTIVILVLLVVLSAFFSAAETAFTSANKIRLKSRAENGSKKAENALAIIERYDKTLTTILIGNNIVNILTSSLATVLFIKLLGTHGTLVSTVAVTVVVLVFGEILPKTLAKMHAENFACAVSGIMKFLMIVFTPLSAVFILLQKGVSRLFGGKGGEVSMTEQELMQIIDEIEDEGVLEEQESDLVRSALEFDETLVSAIITPRVNVAAAEINTGVEEMKELFLREGYSRIPVYEKSVDHIVGIVKHKDFFEKLVSGESFYVRDLVQETMFVPGLMKIPDVLRKMQRSKTHLAVVVDQYGGTDGIVTIEDIMEELVGEIWDETDEVKAPVRFISENVFETSGEVAQNDFNRYFEGRFEINSDSNTVGGWIYELFGRIPQEGETIETENFRITVVSLDELRVGKLRFEILPGKDEQQERVSKAERPGDVRSRFSEKGQSDR
ncbi:MAG: HlyC/CorC family transporter [Ruminiclostridium sp.]|nr:HlyC/CorC family transporter [Ruminiclostridium sp.]